MKKFVSPCTVFLLLVVAVSLAAQQQTQPPATGTSPPATSSAPAQDQAQPPAAGKQPSEPSSAKTQGPATSTAPAPPKAQAPATSKPSGGSSGSRGTKADSSTPDLGYVIGVADVIGVDVWQEKEFGVKAQVRPDGKISMPLLNDVQAAGLTPTELAASLTTLLGKYVTDPRVTVMVEQINSRIIYLSGEINKPGSMPLIRDMTVLQALTLAGGPNQFANSKKIYVMRTVKGKMVKYPFDYKKALKLGPGKDNIILQPGDTIVVP